MSNMPENNIAINQKWFDATDRGDWETVRELMAPEFKIHFPPSLGLADGPVEKDTFLELLKHFEFRHEIHDMFAADDKVVARLDIHLTQNKEFQGIQPTGEEITTPGIIIRRFEEGKITEECVMEDTLAFMQQLGVVDPPEA